MKVASMRVAPYIKVRFPPDTALTMWHLAGIALDFDSLSHAIEKQDPRFDGWVFCGVTTTGIYCRPSCPARTPKRKHIRFFPTAAAAQAAGFRACKRCRPDATPGSPEWNRREDLVGRAMRLIADGVVDREGVRGLAVRLGYTERHIHREVKAVAGAGPLALARAQRAQTARILLETTPLSAIEVAFAAGFRSVRQFNETVRTVFAASPSELRANARAHHDRGAERSAIALRLPFRSPLDGEGLIAFLRMRAAAGVEEAIEGGYRRSLRLPHGGGVVELRPGDRHVNARFWLDDLRDLGPAIQRSRNLLDLDSDPLAVLDALAGDALLGPLVRRAPGRRIAGHVESHELALRAVLGQQVSLAGARTLAGRLVRRDGERLKQPVGAVTHLFPSAETLAGIDPARLAMPPARRRALIGLAAALAAGELVLDIGCDRERTRSQLLELRGIGRWTAGYIALRALRDPDAFLPTDLGVRRALEALGQDGRPLFAERLAKRWRPYRAYAVAHLWAQLHPARKAPSALHGASSPAGDGFRTSTSARDVAGQIRRPRPRRQALRT